MITEHTKERLDRDARHELESLIQPESIIEIKCRLRGFSRAQPDRVETETIYRHLVCENLHRYTAEYRCVNIINKELK